METIYRAEDGTVFDEEIECLEYEHTQRMKDSDLFACKVWDDNFGKIYISPTSDHWINAARYYYAPTEKAKAAMNYLFDRYFGYNTSPFDDETFDNPDHHFAMWSDDLDRYVDIEEEFVKLNILRMNLEKIATDTK